MSDALNIEQEKQLLEQGFLWFRGLAAPDEIRTMNAAWDAAAAELPNDGADHNWGPDLLPHEAFARCSAHPKVKAALALLLGDDVRLRSLHGRAPPKGHGRQGLHADWPTAAPPDIVANAFWLLDEVDAENGATRIVPGSHRVGRIPPKDYAQPHARHPREIPLSGSPGDVVVFSAHLWHAGTENQSGRRRRVVLVQFSRGEVRMG